MEIGKIARLFSRLTPELLSGETAAFGEKILL
jgi:hypothetical protein